MLRSLFFLSLISIVVSDSPYTWVCRTSICTKVNRSSLNENEIPLPMDICKLNCDDNGTLWPLPTGKIEISKEFFHFYPQNVDYGPFNADEPTKTMLGSAALIFDSYLLKMHPDYSGEGFVFPQPNSTITENKISINIAAVYADRVVKIGNDESYTIALVNSADGKTVTVSIIANTYFGARHGLETLSQLIAYNEDTQSLSIVKHGIISDKPKFTYRGVLMDTSRNFISIPSLRRLIDGLSYNKLNFFHWHITDTHSFPMESKRRPMLTEYGSYSKRHIYTVEQMKDLVEYGRLRGVKVLPEFDAPAHVGNGWEWGPMAGLGDLAVCINKEPWFSYCVEPPCGQLNPINDNVYTVLGDLYADFFDIFENDVFHMGGDEVHLNCWNSTPQITDWLISNGKGLSKEDFIELWASFQSRAFEKLKSANNGSNIDAILWTSELVSKDHIEQYISNSSYIVQIWTYGPEEGTVIPFLIEKGYRTIFSNADAWYLDCGYGAWVGNGTNNWCSPYKGWQQVYENSPIRILANYTNEEVAQEAFNKGLLLGGEAAMWSEQVDEYSVESKIWPRGAALGERLWSDPSTSWHYAETRMLNQRQRMVQRGLKPDQLQPQWCHQNEKECVL